MLITNILLLNCYLITTLLTCTMKTVIIVIFRNYNVRFRHQHCMKDRKLSYVIKPCYFLKNGNHSNI